ncbi:uncharacterized protein N7459_003053 [Penicillium hispanicum]|uniref:uncharacterized protein n=1 Tax=Penicillium hispanicum TaxID=1080232 RepID=UPI0025419DB0|nr:uncharacterized protein N7459_003053 [Penicillium hispanicum]KAJ5587288.1 hypothetical protein N7459_003053 [Penicillium hispanicum]
MKYNIPTLLALYQETDVICDWTKDAKACKLLRPRQHRKSILSQISAFKSCKQTVGLSTESRPTKTFVPKAKLHCRSRPAGKISSYPTFAVADDGFARFLREHSSPKNQRVTAGGRIVPMERGRRPSRGSTSRSARNAENEHRTPMREEISNNVNGALSLYHVMEPPPQPWPNTRRTPGISFDAILPGPVQHFLMSEETAHTDEAQQRPRGRSREQLEHSSIRPRRPGRPLSPYPPNMIRPAVNGIGYNEAGTPNEGIGTLINRVRCAVGPVPVNVGDYQTNLCFLYHAAIRASQSGMQFAIPQVLASLQSFVSQLQSNLDDVNARIALVPDRPPQLRPLRVYFTRVRGLAVGLIEHLNSYAQFEREVASQQSMSYQFPTEVWIENLPQSHQMNEFGDIVPPNGDDRYAATVDDAYWDAYADDEDPIEGNVMYGRNIDSEASTIIDTSFHPESVDVHHTAHVDTENHGEVNGLRMPADMATGQGVNEQDVASTATTAIATDAFPTSSRRVHFTAESRSNYPDDPGYYDSDVSFVELLNCDEAPNVLVEVNGADTDDDRRRFNWLDGAVDGGDVLPRRPHATGMGHISQTMPWSYGRRSRQGLTSISEEETEALLAYLDLDDNELVVGTRSASMPIMNIAHTGAEVSSEVKDSKDLKNAISSHVPRDGTDGNEESATDDGVGAGGCEVRSGEGEQVSQMKESGRWQSTATNHPHQTPRVVCAGTDDGGKPANER